MVMHRRWGVKGWLGDGVGWCGICFCGHVDCRVGRL